jgi:hypothetical protein
MHERRGRVAERVVPRPRCLALVVPDPDRERVPPRRTFVAVGARSFGRDAAAPSVLFSHSSAW